MFGLVKHTPNEWYLLESVVNIDQVIWLDDSHTYIVSEEKVLLVDLRNGSRVESGERGVNELVGIDKEGDLLYCRFENFSISKIGEYSTYAKIYNGGRELIKEFKFLETLRPILLYDTKLVLVTALDILEERYFEADLGDGTYKEIPVKFRDFNVYIPKGMQVKEVYYRSNDRYIVEDLFGNVYVRSKDDVY